MLWHESNVEIDLTLTSAWMPVNDSRANFGSESIGGYRLIGRKGVGPDGRWVLPFPR